MLRHGAARGFLQALRYQALFLQLHPGNFFHVQSQKSVALAKSLGALPACTEPGFPPSSQSALSQATVSFSCRHSPWEPPAFAELLRVWKSRCHTLLFALFS